MQRLLDRLDEYSITNFLGEYSSDLSEVQKEEGLCPHQPISRYESDFVSVTSSKELSSLYRRDYITHVNDGMESTVMHAATIESDAIKTESFDTKLSSYRETTDLVDEMRQMFSNNGSKKITDLELLAELDIHLEKLDRCKRGYSELSKSIPTAAYSAFKEKLLKKDNTPTQSISVISSDSNSFIKQPIRRCRSGKRKLVRRCLHYLK